MTLRSPQTVEINGRNLADILDDHQAWLGSGFRDGERAVLAGADLRAVNLAGCDLRQADLTGAGLTGADLARAKLNGARLRGTNLRNAVLNGAALTDDADPASIADSPLFGPTPTDMRGADVGGADLTIALLPESVPLKRRLNDAAHLVTMATRIGGLLLVLLGLAVAGLLRTHNADLLRDAPLPLIPLTPTMLFWFTPVVLLLLYCGWHFSSLGRFWRAAAQLPAFLPDGSSLAAYAPLWPLNAWVALRMPLLVEASESRWDRLRGQMVGAIVWWLTPGVLFLFWWRYLVLHEPVGTFVHAAVTVSALAIGASWHSAALRSFHPGEKPHPREKRRSLMRPMPAALAVALVMGGVSYLAFESKLPGALGRSLEIRFEDFGEAPGVQLGGRNLRFAVLSYCSLRGADLAEARLEEASFAVSDLALADLRGADLRAASLFSARLQGAQLDGADLRGANLRCASGLTDAQLETALTDAATVLPDGSQGPFQAGALTTQIDIAACTHWQPGGTQVPPAMIERFLLQFPALPEIDLEPIPELETSPDPSEETEQQQPAVPPEENETGEH